jgi:hypothetical protein
MFPERTVWTGLFWKRFGVSFGSIAAAVRTSDLFGIDYRGGSHHKLCGLKIVIFQFRLSNTSSKVELREYSALKNLLEPRNRSSN